jgi:hypothetical protein
MSQNVPILPKEMFDKKFVVAATLIGVAYTVIVVILGSTIGKEAAGIAGVTLTALATGIFKKFETLRFRHQSDDQTKSIELPAFRIWYFLLILFAFFGLQLILGAILGSVLGALGLMPDLSNPEAASILLNDPKVWILLVGLTTVAYFLGGYLVGKTAPSVTYTYAIVAALLTLLIPLMLSVIPLLILLGKEAIGIFAPSLYLAIFWLLYVVAALIGSKLGFRKNIPAELVAVSDKQVDREE